MSQQGVIRTLKGGGGCSICKASPQNVGKRRCQHVLDGATMTVVTHQGLKTIDISGQVDGKNTTFSIAAAEQDIKKYISNLSDGLSRKEKQSILAVLRDE